MHQKVLLLFTKNMARLIELGIVFVRHAYACQSFFEDKEVVRLGENDLHKIF